MSVRHAIDELHASMDRALVCAERATVTRDDRRATPYDLTGDVVGYVTLVTDEGFQLQGFTFATWVNWRDARGAWARSKAPDPCVHCLGRNNGTVVLP